MAEDELVALYLNEKYGVIIRNVLEEMGHPQPSMPLHTHKCTAYGIVNRTIFQIRSKSINIHVYWTRDE